jgi:2-polyprenyl-3-methyl-5-hydroxy-6-metoxy-1,4-benzoquinol methylase
VSKCPLCGSTNILEIEEFKSSDLIRIVPKDYRTAITSEINGIEEYCVSQCSECGLIFFLPYSSGSGKFYELLSGLESYYQKMKPEYLLVQPYLPKPLRMLEVGCGAGYFKESIRPAPTKYCGLEMNKKAINEARARGLTVYEENVETYAMGHKEEFNAVGSFQVIEHVPDVRSFISASMDCLERGGVFFFAVPNQDSFVGQAPDQFLNLPPHHLTRWPKRTLENLPRIFPLNMITVIEEDLADYHLDFYIKACFEIGRNTSRNIQPLFITRKSTSRRCVDKLSQRAFIRRYLEHTKKGMSNFRPHLVGQSMIGVYTKQ